MNRQQRFHELFRFHEGFRGQHAIFENIKLKSVRYFHRIFFPFPKEN